MLGRDDVTNPSRQAARADPEARCDDEPQEAEQDTPVIDPSNTRAYQAKNRRQSGLAHRYSFTSPCVSHTDTISRPRSHTAPKPTLGPPRAPRRRCSRRPRPLGPARQGPGEPPWAARSLWARRVRLRRFRRAPAPLRGRYGSRRSRPRGPSLGPRHRSRPGLRPMPQEPPGAASGPRSEEHTSELQSPDHLVCRLLLEKKKKQKKHHLLQKKKKENIL